MEVQTTRLAVPPPIGALPVARAPRTTSAAANGPTTSPSSDSGQRAAAPQTPPESHTAEALQQRRRANTPSGVRLQVDETVDRVIAQILNEDNEVIKQIPPEEAVRYFARFREITGLIFDLEI